jgi:hypothetical protein
MVNTYRRDDKPKKVTRIDRNKQAKRVVTRIDMNSRGGNNGRGDRYE